jgi:uncharacterized protein (TIGR00375 family)
MVMKYYADLHIHSKYSRATSSQLDLEHLWLWAQIKGITVVATGDCVHPGWLAEIKQKLAPCGNGLFELKPEYCCAVAAGIPPSCKGTVRFLLSTEISSIYKRDGAVRKVHNVVYLPSLDAADKLAAKLGGMGNIRSDGRPILGLDSRDLLDIVLSCDPDAFLIPAHVWTPWFSALGSKSGFDSIEECFGDLTRYVYALETGLSSDPAMNWRLSSLDSFVLVSNSDAHSPNKLGREANIFETDLSYCGILDALRNPGSRGLAGTLEFFPEEGKYHFDGHRKCGTRLHPRETIKNKGLCPVCGKPVTVGVMARVEELADRPDGAKGKRWRPYHSMIPLSEIIGDCLGVGPASQKVESLYWRLAGAVGNELSILLDAPLDRIEKTAGALVSEGVRRVRSGEVSVKAGYDGEYGIIKIFSDKERAGKKGQVNLFGDGAPAGASQAPKADSEDSAAAALPRHKKKVRTADSPHNQNAAPASAGTHAPNLNKAQLAAVNYGGSHLLIIAGPGTGKTHTLVHRIVKAAARCAANEKILAVTFTNKAAEEMRERICKLIGPELHAIVTVGTFHQFCLGILRANAAEAGIPADFRIASDDDCSAAAARAWPTAPAAERRAKLEVIGRARAGMPGEAQEDVDLYKAQLRAANVLDFDDLLEEAVRLLSKNAMAINQVRATYRSVLVDEFQDINAAQHALLTLLVKDGVSLTAIGDPNQAIYGFRGSDIRFFEQFEASFPGAATMVLSENYRSAANLLEASGHVIASGNTDSAPLLVARFLGNGRLTIHETATEKAEAEYIVHQLEKLVGGTSMFSHDSGRLDSGDTDGKSFGDFAVLYRTNAQSGPLVEAFERSGIPFQVSGEKPLAQYPFVKEAVAYLLEHAPGELGESSDTDAAAALGRFAQESPVAAMLEKDDRVGGLLDRLQHIAAFHASVQSFLDYILLQQKEEPADIRVERVSLLTLHASKGLEFPVVFIAGCEDGLVPLKREGKHFDPAEERRLFYVGMTRAKERLYLTSARRRTMYGKTIDTRPSPFVADIKEELKTYEKTAAMNVKKAAESEQTDFLGDLFLPQ